MTTKPRIHTFFYESVVQLSFDQSRGSNADDSVELCYDWLKYVDVWFEFPLHCRKMEQRKEIRCPKL